MDERVRQLEGDFWKRVVTYLRTFKILGYVVFGVAAVLITVLTWLASTASQDLEEALEKLEKMRAGLQEIREAAAEPSYSVRLFNIDDEMWVEVNDRRVGETCTLFLNHACYYMSGAIEPHLVDGRNVISIYADNGDNSTTSVIPGNPFTYGFEIRENGVLVAAETCGSVHAVGQTLAGNTGMIQEASCLRTDGVVFQYVFER